MRLGDRVRYLASHPAFRAEPVRVCARLGWWYLRARLPRPALIRLGSLGCVLELPPRWRGTSKLIYVFRERYEPELAALPVLVDPGSVAVDVGACYGIYTCVLGRLVGPTGRVHAIEPAGDALAVLRRNVERNGLAWVQVHPSACADFSGDVWLRHHADPSRNALEVGGSAGASGEGELVKVVRLDDLVPAAAFVKIDVEGAEELVLREASSLLRRSRPVVMFEVNPEAASRMGLAQDGAWRLLEGLGYRFLRADDAGQLRAADRPPAVGNVIAVPGDGRASGAPR